MQVNNPEVILKAAGELRSCSTRLEIESVFTRYDIQAVEAKVQLLRGAMGVEEIYFSDGGDMAEIDSDSYEDEISIFVEGSWRFVSA